MDNYTTEVKDDVLTFIFQVELDTFTCIELEEGLLEIVKKHNGSVVFDMSKVEFVASSFIRLCGATASAIGQEDFSLLNLNKNIKKVFKKVGLTSVIKIR
ncbi:MAG: STAS domain-containing protein [bacterium]|nr:STAS domain-containing protein [bacterium]